MINIEKEDLEEILFFLEVLLEEWKEQEVYNLTIWKKKYEALDRRIEMLRRLA